MRPSARRRTALLAVVLTLAGLSSACAGGDTGGGRGSTAAGGQPEAERAVQLTVATFGESGYQELFREYQADNPNVRITERKAATVEEHVRNLDANLAKGTGLADIEAMEVNWIHRYLTQDDQFADLRQYGADALKDRWPDWKVAGATTADGKIIGYGTDIGPVAICYRKDLFARAGLPTDRAQVARLFPDWASYFAVGRQFGAKVPGPAWYDSAVLTWEAMRNQLVQAYYSNEDRYLADENESLRRTWDQLVRGTRDGLSAKLPPWSEQWRRGFRSDAFATVVCPSWMLRVIEDEAGADGRGKWDVADVFPGGGANWGGSYLTVPAQSDEPEEAARLAAWLTAPEQGVKMFRAIGSFPSAVAAYDDGRLTAQVNPYFHDAPVGQIFVNRAKDVILQQHKGPRDREINEAFTAALRRVDEGRQRPEAAWEQALREADKAAAD